MHTHERDRMQRALERIGHQNSEMLADPVDLIILQRHARFTGRAFLRQLIGVGVKRWDIGACENADHARCRFRGREVDRENPAIRNRALNQLRMNQPIRRKLAGIFCCTGHFQSAVNSRERLGNRRRNFDQCFSHFDFLLHPGGERSGRMPIVRRRSVPQSGASTDNCSRRSLTPDRCSGADRRPG